eukprot:TRINITY_DN21050_c0_g1_i1.p1 TRINITY_DN21050_c0_g1~~TRINITY_DN21050_c0_g1_i1.p1  ORF type:complete len:489 (-),score=88.98 TRINITY_DN21050_c0_g1_i1:36-1502(-)
MSPLLHLFQQPFVAYVVVVLPWLTVAAVVVNVLWLYTLRVAWKQDFSHRSYRSAKESPSNKLRPRTEKIFECLEKYELKWQLSPKTTEAIGTRLSRFETESADLRKRSQPLLDLTLNGKHTLCTDRSDKLDMDHVRVEFLDFVWAFYFIAPNAMLLCVTGILWLKLREIAQRAVACWSSRAARGPPVDYERLVGTLVLESFQLVHFAAKRETEDGRQVATFVWPDLPMLDAKGQLVTAEMFRVDIDLSTKRMVSATLDGEPLVAQDVVILVWFDTISANHVKIHAFANWAVNVQHCGDAFQHRMSVATVMYNYFGRTVFRRLAALWYRWGLSSCDFHNITEMFEAGLQQGVPHHKGLRELVGFSDLAKFIIPLRNHFLNTFQEHRHQFPGIDGEAFFVGTILHSLDHTLMEWNLLDPLHLDVRGCDPRFSIMAELGRYVRVGFVPDLPMLMFTKGFVNAPGAFYKRIYEFASTLNKKMADRMDCCIIK